MDLSRRLLFIFNIYSYFTCMDVLCIYVQHACSTHKDQKRLIELELQMIVSSHVILGAESSLLQDQQMSVTAKPPLQHLR